MKMAYLAKATESTAKRVLHKIFAEKISCSFVAELAPEFS
jgi:hypothetical protein